MAAIANDMSNFGHCFPNINSLVTYIFYILKGFTSNFNAFREIKQSAFTLELEMVRTSQTSPSYDKVQYF